MKMGWPMKHEGTLHIRWMNRTSRESEPVYKASFLDYLSSVDSVKVLDFRGDPALLRFLRDEVRVRQNTLDSVLPGLREAGSVSIFNVILDDSELRKVGLADGSHSREKGAQ